MPSARFSQTKGSTQIQIDNTKMEKRSRDVHVITLDLEILYTLELDAAPYITQLDADNRINNNTQVKKTSTASRHANAAPSRGSRVGP